MIPLSRPYKNQSGSKVTINNFISDNFIGRYYSLTFSARQGLVIIYKELKQTNGALRVAVSPLTCVEALYPIIQNGHDIHFVDIDHETFNMDETIIPNNIDVIQAIHFGGNPQNMSLIEGKHPSFIVEDCAQSLGSKYCNQETGTFGDYVSLSFMKNIYSLGGGLLISKKELVIDETAFKKMDQLSLTYRYLKRYLELKCSYNTNINFLWLKLLLSLKPDNSSSIIADLSNNSLIIKSIESQLGIYNKIIDKRIRNAKYLRENIRNPQLRMQGLTEHGEPNFLRLFFVIEGRDTREVVMKLRRKGIGANHITQNISNPYQERLDKNIHLKKYFSKTFLPNYFKYHDRIFSVPVSPSLSKAELDYIITNVNKL